MTDSGRRVKFSGKDARRSRLHLLAAVCAVGLLAGCALPGARDEQTARFLKAAELDSAYGNFLAARQARREYDHAAAARFYLRALKDEPNNALLAQGAFLSLIADGRVGDALELAPALRANNPNDHMPRLVLAASALMRRDWDQALAVVNEGPNVGVHAAFNPLISAWAFAGKGEADNAEQALARLERNPLFAGVHDYLKPLLQEVTGRLDAAERTYVATLDKRDRAGTRQVDGYIRLLERQGRINEARTALSEHLAANPDHPVLSRAKQRLDKPSATVAPLVGNAVEGFAESLFAAASAFGRSDGGELAELHLQVALFLRPDLDDAIVLMGDVYEGRKQWERALQMYSRVRPDSDYADTARTRTAWCINELGRHEEAVRLLRRMAAEKRDDARGLLTLADMYRQMERWADSASVYSEALARIPKIEQRHWAILFGRGVAYERAKQWEKAEPDMLQALELQPEQPLVLNYLGYTWVDQGKNLERATKMIERAVALRPNDGAIVDSLGWALYRQNRFEEAVVQLERAVELKGGDPVITDHLGDAYWRVGREEEARFQWRRALGLKPESDLEVIVKRKLEQGLDPVAAK